MLAYDTPFFVQAEDGIRVLVRSRRLGDVYKRQVLEQRHRFHDLAGLTEATLRHIQSPAGHLCRMFAGRVEPLDRDDRFPLERRHAPLTGARRYATHMLVSYTHLTLPTSDSV